MAFLSVRQHNHDLAIVELQEALAFFRQSGSTLSQAVTLLALTAVLLSKDHRLVLKEYRKRVAIEV